MTGLMFRRCTVEWSDVRFALAVSLVVLPGCGRLWFTAAVGGDASTGPDAWAFDVTMTTDAPPRLDAPGIGDTGSPPDVSGASDSSLPSCPAGYVPMGGGASGYRPGASGNPWLAAEADCEADGTHLVILNDAAEAALITAMFPASATWTGVSDRVTPDVFREVTGAVATYLPWATGEPSVGFPDCVSFDTTTGTVANTRCNGGRLYACECDGRAAVAGTY